MHVFRFDSPERFVVGTIGEAGDRTFYLQARDSRQLTSVVLEKEQVAVLADRVDGLLDEILQRTAGAVSVPAEAKVDDEDLEPLEQPIIEEFRVDTMALSWDGERVVVVAYAPSPSNGDDGADGPGPPSDPDESDRDAMVVRLSGSEARAFARRAEAVVAAGRPQCPLCALPIDAEGHICPRQNGYRRWS